MHKSAMAATLTNRPTLSKECGMGVTHESELPALSAAQIEILRRYAMLQATVQEVRSVLDESFDPDLVPLGRRARIRYRLPEPGVVITREHISNALDLKRFGLITERGLSDWATILLANDAFVLAPGDEDLIADWLNDLSANLIDR